ncbi:pumilio4-like [Dorcoceras hygrometricum]|uniref:Pumilio4-like n=1 Tax=Dorcoceras hygrometricum TaxID=472368 RepID=A0A2Z7C6X7_9LAMI|nr:pumilio4-like [Dorcoceras hygrometricum]
MVKMFKVLESSGIREFLGCCSAIYEADLVSFYQNALVRNNTVISSVWGKYVEISEDHFAGAFELPTEGLIDMNEGSPDLDLGESKAFPPLKILMANTVGTYVAKNKNITAEEETDERPMEKIVKKAPAKRRPAPAVAEPAAKKKRTTVGRAAPTEKSLSLVPVATEAEPIYVIPAASPSAIQ